MRRTGSHVNHSGEYCETVPEADHNSTLAGGRASFDYKRGRAESLARSVRSGRLVIDENGESVARSRMESFVSHHSSSVAELPRSMAQMGRRSTYVPIPMQ